MENRVITIEKKVAFQEYELEELTKVVESQQRRIEKLEERMEVFQSVLRNESLVRDEGEEQPPPHY